MAATPSLDYLDHPEKHPAAAVCAVFGDDAYLKREVLKQLRRAVLGDDDGAFSLQVLTGRDAAMRDILDELSTVAMFGPKQRLVIVEEADDFVSRNRPALEDYVAKPRATGVLVLEVGTWASNTRLYKALDKSGLQIECKQPAPGRLLKWLTARAKKLHGVKLDSAAGELLMDLVDPQVGLLDQEVARLALLAGEEGTITSQLVGENVGSWRTKKTWDMIDLAVEGRAKEALFELDRLILAGEDPIGLLAQIASTLRRFAVATELVERATRAGRRVALRSVLQEAGFKPFVLDKAEKQLRQIGRQRGTQLYRWLLEADLAMKGASSGPTRSRFVLEQLIVKLSTAAQPPKAATR